MILDDNEALARLAHEDNIANWENNVRIEKVPSGGRTEGAKAIPMEIRSLIGGLARIGSDSQKVIAGTFGVSQQTVSDASRGLVGNRRDEELEERIEDTEKTHNQKIESAHSAALDLMMQSLEQMKPLMAQGAKLRDLSKTAVDMSKIASNLKSKDGEEGPKVQVVMMTVAQKQESQYEVIDV